MKFVVKERQTEELDEGPMDYLKRLGRAFIGRDTPPADAAPTTDPADPAPEATAKPKKDAKAKNLLNGIGVDPEEYKHYRDTIRGLVGKKNPREIALQIAQEIKGDMEGVVDAKKQRQIVSAAKILTSLYASQAQQTTAGTQPTYFVPFGGSGGGSSGEKTEPPSASGTEKPAAAVPEKTQEEKRQIVNNKFKLRVLGNAIDTYTGDEELKKTLAKFFKQYRDELFDIATREGGGVVKIGEAAGAGPLDPPAPPPAPTPKDISLKLSSLIKNYITNQVAKSVRGDPEKKREERLAYTKKTKEALKFWQDNSGGQVDVEELLRDLATFELTLEPPPPVAPPAPPPAAPTAESKIFKQTRPGVFALKG